MYPNSSQVIIRTFSDKSKEKKKKKGNYFQIV